MKADVHCHYQSCLNCVSRKSNRRTFKSPLLPILVGGPFHCVGVDVFQLPITVNGNRYVIVFVDYLTKWPEAFTVPDQEATTLAHLIMDQVVCHHGAPQELLSDRGANFLSSLVREDSKIFGMKINRSGYHPQTDGLVEKFNSTLISIIAKSAVMRPADWNTHLPCMLLASCTSAQESTRIASFPHVWP